MVSKKGGAQQTEHKYELSRSESKKRERKGSTQNENLKVRIYGVVVPTEEGPNKTKQTKQNKNRTWTMRSYMQYADEQVSQRSQPLSRPFDRVWEA